MTKRKHKNTKSNTSEDILPTFIRFVDLPRELRQGILYMAILGEDEEPPVPDEMRQTLNETRVSAMCLTKISWQVLDDVIPVFQRLDALYARKQRYWIPIFDALETEVEAKEKELEHYHGDTQAGLDVLQQAHDKACYERNDSLRCIKAAEKKQFAVKSAA